MKVPPGPSGDRVPSPYWPETKNQNPLFAIRNFTGETKHCFTQLLEDPMHFEFLYTQNSHDEFFGIFSCDLTCLGSKYFSNKIREIGL